MAGLLVEFFRYYAWTFDFRHDVVSIRHSGKLSKLDKAEQHGWLQSDILSIEDPFETHYDVAHVIKSAQMVYLRKEMLVSTKVPCMSTEPKRTISPCSSC